LRQRHAAVSLKTNEALYNEPGARCGAGPAQHLAGLVRSETSRISLLVE
jgi:hypothetical protein